MSSRAMRQAPDPKETGWPKGIPYIIGNEGCERFSYYGMSAILYIYAVSLFIDQSFNDADSARMAISTVHFFKTGVYALPMVGAIIADRYLGKYRTILYLSLVYCLGHLVLSLTEGSINGMYAGLALIALGSGGIKPCVSANVGDQFGAGNFRLVEKVYQAFYFMINFGSFFATLSIPLMQKWYGYRIAFAIPGVLMFVATVIFWMGRKHFVDVPAKPGGKLGLYDAASSVFLFMSVGSIMFTSSQPLLVIAAVSVAFLTLGLYTFSLRQKIQEDDGFLAVSVDAINSFFSRGRTQRRIFNDEAVEGTKAVLKLISVFGLVSVFWALFDQHSSSWIRQAEMMNRSVTIPGYDTVELLPSQVQSLNPILVMILIPILSFFVFPLVRRMGIEITPLRKMSAGMLISALAFATVAMLQLRIDALKPLGEQVHFFWQCIPFFLITVGEVLVSITGLEFAYSQAPRRMKSTIMGFWLMSVALGNMLVALLARFGNLELANFFWVFAFLMFAATLLFSARSLFYQSKVYTQ